VRCATHGLATGPDGACVLCRSTEKRGSGTSNAPLVALVTVVLLVGGTALAFRLSGTPPVPSKVAGEKPRIEPEVRARTPAVERAEAAEPLAANAAAIPPLPVAPTPTFGAEEPLAAPSASLSTSASALASAEPVPRAPSSAEVAAAIRATPIVMFSTSWCGVCRHARAFLGANRLAYTERDIDEDAAANAELRRLTGKAAVPAFLVDGQLVGPGFSESSLKRALVASVERRLGVRAEARSR
jgi:glutaredoxin